MGLLFPPKLTGPNAPTQDEYKSGKVREERERGKGKWGEMGDETRAQSPTHKH